MDEQEEWRPVVGWEGFYEVSSSGRVRSVDRVIRNGRRWLRLSGRVLQPSAAGTGYPQVVLSREGSQRSVKVHWLVCEAFHGARPFGFAAAHNNGDRSDNTAANLRWSSYADNSQDSADHGTLYAGEQHRWAKLKADDVRGIRASGSPGSVLAKQYGISEAQVSQIKHRRRWKQL